MMGCSDRSRARVDPERPNCANRIETVARREATRARIATALFTLLATLAFASTAHANGRFPSAQYVVVGPGRSDDLIAVRATFGLVVSDDGGRRFRFVCEEAFEYRDGYDPSLVWTANGTLLVGVEDGLQATQTLCDPTRRRELDGQYVVDLTNDATGRVVLAALRSRDADPMMRVARSDDGGATFDVPRDGLASMAPLTVDIAPSDPMRAYASALADPNRARDPVLLRSDDGGRAWRRTRAVFSGAADVYVSGVDPLRPDVLYLRARLRSTSDGGAPDAGSALYVSEDGGESVREIARTVGPMAGFALSGDGARVWIGGPDARDGLRMREGAGEFRTVSSQGVECLRWHAGALYLCDVLGLGGAVLSRSRDDGSTREPLVRVEDVLPPPPSCGASSIVSGFCADRWVSIRATTLSTLRDGGALDAALDAPRDVVSEGPLAPPTGCAACATTPKAETSALAWAALCVLGAVRRGRRALTHRSPRGQRRAR